MQVAANATALAAPRRSPRVPVSDPEKEVGQLLPKQRALRAAQQLLDGVCGTLSEAAGKWGCQRQLVSYYLKRLKAAGAEAVSVTTETSEEATPAASTGAAGTESQWDTYVQAYTYAGQLYAEHGKRKAAALASEKFGVDISPSTARRAAG